MDALFVQLVHPQLGKDHALTFLISPAMLPAHLIYLPATQLPFVLSHRRMKPEYDARNIKLVFQKQFSWNSELSI